MPHETPSRAWQIVGTDIFVINRETYLLVSDYHSKFPFVYMIPSPVTSTAVIGKMKLLFAEQGVTQRVISGHFSCEAFRRYADQWFFDHVTSSPHYPQSNGHIERQVQTVKRTLKKVGFRSDVQMALLVRRATPIDSDLPSPAELLYGRMVVHVRTRHPVTQRWEPVRIVDKCQQPHSYNVESVSGSILRRNRRVTRETAEKHVFLSTAYEIFDCGASRTTCDSCFCRASAITCWFDYSQILC